MKCVLLALAVLTLSTALWAQSGDGVLQCDCEQSPPVTISDTSCKSPFNCMEGSTADCASTTFTASCTGHYTFSISLSCSGGNCSDYNVCAQLYDANTGQYLGHCYDTGNCSPCGNNCPTLCLYAGRQYTLYVCLLSCGAEECPSPPTCQAIGSVKYCGPGNITCQ